MARLKKGSAKNVLIETEPTASKMGRGVFEFKDDYSVFDYGAMPDTIPGKAESLARLSAFNLREISKQGVKTHFVSFIEPNKIEVEMVRVIQPVELNEGEVNYLIPLEVIFRNSLPAGSSVFRRVKNGEASWSDFGFDREPTAGERLTEPLIDFSTKLEVTDRYLTHGQAQELARLDDGQFARLEQVALKVNEFVSRKAESVGLLHEDGKIECALDFDGNVILVDVFGTLDENRFSLNGTAVSKQVLRDYYLKTQWYQELKQAQAAGLPKDKWPAPSRLPPEFVSIVSNLYKSLSQAWTGFDFSAPAVEEAVSAYGKWSDNNG
ncbi:MAG: phosphoribosylaminoimidazolesuccinocarboxamide synthase [Candidatus Micrarchaeota archaeon]